MKEMKKVEKRPFCATCTYERSFYQDRLGTNIGKPQKKTVLLQAMKLVKATKKQLKAAKKAA